MPLDYITASLKRNFKECNINDSVIINESSEKLALLLSTVINIMDTKDEKFIIDSANIMPKDIIKYLDKDKWDVYFLGYPNIEKYEKFNIIRKYDTKDDWTYRKDDEELLEIIEKLIDISRNIQKECDELDINFIDTSNDIIKSIKKLYK